MAEIQQSHVISGGLKKYDKVISKKFAEFLKKTQQKAEFEKKKGLIKTSLSYKVMKTYGPYGAFQIKDLKKEGVLVDFKLGGRALMPV